MRRVTRGGSRPATRSEDPPQDRIGDGLSVYLVLALADLLL
jgi:hypothetical protein